MQRHSDPGPIFPFPSPLPFTRRNGLRPRVGVWQRWRSLHDDILRHVRACDRLGIELTVEQLAEELDEALGLVERRVEELGSLQLLHCHSDGRVELDVGYRPMCG